MKHLGTKILETDRLILRPFGAGDAQAMYANWASDPKVTEFLSWPTYKSIDDAHSILKIWLEGYEKPGFLPVGYRSEGIWPADWLHFSCEF